MPRAPYAACRVIALLLLCAAYLMPGLLGRGPWKSADIAAFGYMAELAAAGEASRAGSTRMLLGLRPETPALIPYWIGAWAIKIAPAWIHPDLAVRIAFALLLCGTLAATWYAVYYLARTTQAQPVAFAFGGEARPTDYARAIADGALLALIACLGLAQLGHETTPALAQLFFASQLFYGVAALPYHRVGAVIALLIGTVGMTLSGGAAVGMALGSAAPPSWPLDRRRAPRQRPTTNPPIRSAPSPSIFGATVLAGLLAVWLGLLHWQIDLPGSHAGKTLSADLRSQADSCCGSPGRPGRSRSGRSGAGAVSSVRAMSRCRCGSRWSRWPPP